MIRRCVIFVAAAAMTSGSACFAAEDSAAGSAGVANDSEWNEDDEDEGAGDGGQNSGIDGGESGSSEPGDDGGTPPPEQEMEANFRVPRASGGFVYSTSESTNSVAVIDSSTLGIEVVAVGRKPTVVLPIDPGSALGAVAVLNQDSDDVSLLRTIAAGETTVEWREITPGANNLAVTPDGRYVFAHVDVDAPEEIGPGSDQEVSVIDVTSNQVARMTVGAHPRTIAFSPDSEFAYIVTADGVNVVAMGDGMFDGKPDIVPVHVEQGIVPSELEVHVAPRHGIALARIDGDRRLVATDLHLRSQQVFTLPGVPTDLDISPDDGFALLTLPSLTGSSRLFELTLPLDEDSELREHLVADEYVGLTQIAPDGQTLVLYTSQQPTLTPPPDDDGGGESGSTGESSTGPADDADASSGSTGTPEADTDGESQGESSGSTGAIEDAELERRFAAATMPTQDDPRLRITVARRSDDGWDTSVTLFVDRPLATVGIAPDSANAILVHQGVATEVVPHAYTLVDLAKAFPVKKTQTVTVYPDSILFTPEGDRAVVLLRGPENGEQRVEQVDLRSFVVEGLGLGSPPEGAGYVESTEKVFVAQEHPTGRITFIDRNGAIETVTGFRLNDAIKD